MPKIQLGGERGYGWGRVAIEKDPYMCSTFFDYELDSSQTEPVVKIPKDNFILAHTCAEQEESKQQIEGNIEPFVGRITKDGRRFGAQFSEASICWVPGSKLVKSDMNFKICEDELWSIKSN